MIGDKALIEHVIDGCVWARDRIESPVELAVSTNEPFVNSVAQTAGIPNIQRPAELFEEEAPRSGGRPRGLPSKIPKTGRAFINAMGAVYGSWCRTQLGWHGPIRVQRVMGNTLILDPSVIVRAVEACTDDLDGVLAVVPAQAMIGDLLRPAGGDLLQFIDPQQADLLSHQRRMHYLVSNAPCPQWLYPDPWRWSDFINGRMGMVLDNSKTNCVHIHDSSDLEYARLVWDRHLVTA